MGFQLLYGDLVVGDLTDAYEDQGNWYGNFSPAISESRGPLERRICEFIAFCEDFNAQCRTAEDPGPEGFDRFCDLHSTPSWRVRAPSGAVSVIEGFPNFLGDGFVGWITV